MSEFVRFPRTPHLLWLGDGAPRDDKVLSQEEAKAFLCHDVIVEEKFDGTNIGISVGDEGVLRVQRRGAFVSLESLDPQFKPLRHWLSVRRPALLEALTTELILFGEWCYARHSVHYDRLPDWFLAFDIFDRGAFRFWSVERRNRLFESLGLAIVPELARGRFDVDTVRERMLGASRFADGPAEGVYLRRDQGPFLEARAKLVRPEFTQAIDEHWSRRQVVPNRLAPNNELRWSVQGD